MVLEPNYKLLQGMYDAGLTLDDAKVALGAILDNETALFKANPSATRFRALGQAMITFQQVQQCWKSQTWGAA